MKRPIKFRGRLWDTGEFVFGNFVTDDQEYLLKFDADSFTCPARIFKIQKASIAQLVGYDKDGNEVYEDDEVVDENGLTGTALLVSEVMGRKNGQFWFVPCKPNFKLKEVQS